MKLAVSDVRSVGCDGSSAANQQEAEVGEVGTRCVASSDRRMRKLSSQPIPCLTTAIDLHLDFITMQKEIEMRNAFPGCHP